MIDKIESTKSTQEKSIYRKIGVGVYIIFALIYYFFMKDMFPDGTFFIVVGIALLLTILFKLLKEHTCDLGIIAFCIYFLIFGLVVYFQLNQIITAISAIILCIVIISLNFKSTKKG